MDKRVLEGEERWWEFRGPEIWGDHGVPLVQRREGERAGETETQFRGMRLALP